MPAPLTAGREVFGGNMQPDYTARSQTLIISGFGKNIANWLGWEIAYPSNVLHLATDYELALASITAAKEVPVQRMLAYSSLQMSEECRERGHKLDSLRYISSLD